MCSWSGPTVTVVLIRNHSGAFSVHSGSDSERLHSVWAQNSLTAASPSFSPSERDVHGWKCSFPVRGCRERQKACFSLTSVTFSSSCERGERGDGRTRGWTRERGEGRSGKNCQMSFLPLSVSALHLFIWCTPFIASFRLLDLPLPFHLLTSPLLSSSASLPLFLSTRHPLLLPFMPPCLLLSSCPVIPPPLTFLTLSASNFCFVVTVHFAIFQTPLSFHLSLFSSCVLPPSPLWFVINPLFCLRLSPEGFERNPLITSCLLKPLKN